MPVGARIGIAYQSIPQSRLHQRLDFRPEPLAIQHLDAMLLGFFAPALVQHALGDQDAAIGPQQP